jgi:hypothetical protein
MPRQAARLNGKTYHDLEGKATRLDKANPLGYFQPAFWNRFHIHFLAMFVTRFLPVPPGSRSTMFDSPSLAWRRGSGMTEEGPA